jgi:hypothetical protein
MTRDDTGLLVIAGSVTSQLENFGCEILKNGSEVDGSTLKTSQLENTIQTTRETYQHQHVEHSCPFAEDGGHDQLGMRDQPWMNDCRRLERDFDTKFQTKTECNNNV